MTPPVMLPVERATHLVQFWLDFAWPLGHEDMEGRLAPLGWRHEPAEDLLITDMGTNHPEVVPFTRDGDVYLLMGRFTDYLADPADADVRALDTYFRELVAAVTADRGIPETLEPEPGITVCGWDAPSGGRVDLVLGRNAVAFHVKNPALVLEERDDELA